MNYIGIDPGLSGAVAVLDQSGKCIHCSDLPLTKEDKPSIDSKELHKILCEFLPAKVIVEKVHAMPGQGVTSMFNFGKSYGAILAAVDVSGANRVNVTPMSWKKHFGLIGTEKDASRVLAVEMFPDAPLKRKKDHGRADALLMAHYGFTA